jgi:cbb3-type cytochrome oxidase cytochrome c subunit/mono/diheme cytochrome c family protein
MTAGPGRVLRMSYIVACVAGVGFFVMSVALLGVWPKRVLDEQTRAMAPEYPLALTASEIRGRAIYGREGCAYCHTQQVRYLRTDMTRFGAPTLAWETHQDYPHLWGTRRIGPDLAREGGARSRDWQFVHLFSPRVVVATSVMPAYPWLFDGAADRPGQEAEDLVAYLDSLGRAREIAGPEGEAVAREGCQCPDDALRQLAFEGPLSAHPAKSRRVHDAPVLPTPAAPDRGRRLYADHCASCHGPLGEGNGPGAATLRPRPTNLVEHEYTDERLADVLWNGVWGTAMPAWRDWPLEDLAAVRDVVQGFGVSSQETADSAVPSDPAAETLGGLGARVYVANCVQCHGETGAGDGSASAELLMDPTDFRRQRPSQAEGLRALQSGVEGTPMAPWTSRLSNAEMLAVAGYVRGFYEGPDR